ncbi:DUF5592 family protein [Lactiplantibacillus plantarum]|uniref:DUF5592 family protein n=1 Tax=Lactiplantibacillus plantarum TaxID=1590 RepID=UPI00201322FA|nr:DUF5592 family protein [Lactiplantibacillus plantarum]
MNTTKPTMPDIGVTPNVKTRMKIFLFYVTDLVIVVLWWGVAMIVANLVLGDAHGLINWLFQLINVVFAIWLVVTPYHNPGRKNYQLIMSDLLSRGHQYRSFDYYEFDSLASLVAIGGRYKDDYE